MAIELAPPKTCKSVQDSRGWEHQRNQLLMALAMAQALLAKTVKTYEEMDPDTVWNDPAGSLEALASALLGEIARPAPMQEAA